MAVTKFSLNPGLHPNNCPKVYRNPITITILVVQEEFDELRHVPREKNFDSKNQIGSNPKFKEFNRYRDIIPYDKTRVELNHCDYVNASWVGPGRTYIATQGMYRKYNLICKTSNV